MATTRARALASRRPKEGRSPSGRNLSKTAHAPAGPEHAGSFADGRLGVGHDSEQQVEQDDVERVVRQVEAVGVERANVGA